MVEVTTPKANPTANPGLQHLKCETAIGFCNYSLVGLVVLWVLVLRVTSSSGYEVTRPGNTLCYYTSPIDGTEQPYFVYIPTTYNPDRPAPVVVSLHGFGGRTYPAAGDAWRQNWANGERWILVNLDGRGNQNWDGIGEDDIFQVLDDLRQTTPYHPALNIDAKRLYLEGCSMGGHGAFREGFRYPDIFAAVAPGAGWTTYKEFYKHWYDAAADPRLPGYVDPARLSVLETASSLQQAENARWVWTFISFDRNDSVNPPENHDPVIEKLRGIWSDRYATRVGEGGHCGSYCTMCNFRFFFGKHVTERPADITYTTNNLRYNTSYWVTINRLRYINQWARLEVRARMTGTPSPRHAQIRVSTQNLLCFSLDLTKSPVSTAKWLLLYVDGKGPIRSAAQPQLHVLAKVDDDNQIRGWSVVPQLPPPAHITKSPRLFGPVGDAFRSHFVVIYGTRGGSRGANTSNPDWVAAQRFSTEWNNWTSLHWGGERPPGNRTRNWWMPPYPFSPGNYIPRNQPLVMPLPDTGFGLDSLPRDANLILFGDVDSNWIIAQAAPHLPLELSSQQIRVRERVYTGDNINYLFIAPSPFERDSHETASSASPASLHYIVISRGYLSSGIDPTSDSAGNVGKDIEALPFYWPDYVVWDRNRAPAATVQGPLKYLPEAFLDAGYFDENWQLDTAPPVSHIEIAKAPPPPRSAIPIAKVTLTADDRPGGFGVQSIEWRIGGGDWSLYAAPIELAMRGIVTLQVRAVDNCGQFVYDRRSPNRGMPAMGNVETPRSFVIDTKTGRVL